MGIDEIDRLRDRALDLETENERYKGTLKVISAWACLAIRNTGDAYAEQEFADIYRKAMSALYPEDR